MENYIIKRSKRKTMSIKINSKGQVIVSVPNKTTDSTVLSFIKKHENWIEEKLNKIDKVLQENAEILNYEKMFYLGKKYKIVYVTGLKEIYLKEDEIFIPSRFQKKIKNHLRDWYLLSFNEIVVSRVVKLVNKLNLNYKEIVAINSIYRWGCCSSDKKLSFNYKILMLDIEVIEYIIVHEVCHLLEMNHQAKFWNKVSLILPNYKELIVKLKNCSYLLRNL